MDDGLPPYPETKASGVSWLGDVPAHWQRLPGRACYQEKKTPNTGLRETAVLSLSYGQIVVKPPEKLFGLVPASFETYQIVEPGDIIVRPTDLQNDWNSLRFGLSHHRGIITSAYMCLRTQPAVLREYGHLLLHAYDLKKVFYGLGSGLRQNLDWRDFKYLPCLVPPLDEQQAIVRYLDHIDRRVRRYIRAKQRLLALLHEQKQAIIHQAVTRGLDASAPLKPSGVAWLGEVPAHWEVKRLKWVTHLQRGYDLSQEQRLPGVVPVVSSGGIIGTHNQARVSSPGVVMGRYGSTDAIYYLEQDFWPHNTALFVTDFYGNDVRWCFHLLSSISKADHAAKSAVPGVDRKDLHDIVVVCPPHDEQVQIAANIDIVLSDLDNNVDRVNKQIDLIREYRTRLIADVVTGKVDVRAAAGALPAEVGEEAVWAASEVEEDGEEASEEELQRMQTENG